MIYQYDEVEVSVADQLAPAIAEEPEEILPNGRTPAEQRGKNLIRLHSKPVQDALQRAGLSRNSELTASEVRRAEEAIDKFPDLRTPSNKIRNHIMPPVRAEEEDNDA